MCKHGLHLNVRRSNEHLLASLTNGSSRAREYDLTRMPDLAMSTSTLFWFYTGPGMCAVFGKQRLEGFRVAQHPQRVLQGLNIIVEKARNILAVGNGIL